MAFYRVVNISVTGTPATPQTVKFADLYDTAGNVLPTFSSVPAVLIQKTSKDCRVYVTENPTVSSFKVAASNVGDGDRPVVINIIVITDIRPYLVNLPTITGTRTSPQTISYSSLTYVDGGSVPNSFATPPVILIQSLNKDSQMFFTEAPGTTYFRVARAIFGDTSGSLTVAVFILGSAPSLFSAGTDIIRTTAVTITGTVNSQQTVNYSNLTDTQGETIATSYTNNPLVFPQAIGCDTDVIIGSNPTSTSFGVFKSNFGDISSTVTCNFILFVVAVTAETSDFSITFEDMISIFGIYIKDPVHKLIPIELKSILLNAVMNQIVRDLKGWVIPELDILASAQAVTGGILNLTSLTTPIFDNANGIEEIRVNGDDGYRCNKISIEEYNRFEDIKFTYSTTNPKYYVRGTKLYFLPSSITSVDIYYKKNITKMIFNTETLTNSDLAHKFHLIIIGLACATFQDEIRAKLLYEFAVLELENIKLQSMPTDTILKHVIHEDEELETEDPYEYNLRVSWENV